MHRALQESMHRACRKVCIGPCRKVCIGLCSRGGDEQGLSICPCNKGAASAEAKHRALQQGCSISRGQASCPAAEVPSVIVNISAAITNNIIPASHKTCYHKVYTFVGVHNRKLVTAIEEIIAYSFYLLINKTIERKLFNGILFLSKQFKRMHVFFFFDY